MKPVCLLLLLLTAALTLRGQAIADSCWSAEVKTVLLTRGGVELEAPVLTLGEDERLLLRFDVLGAEVAAYRWQIRHCDRDWHLDDLEPYEYLSGFEEGSIDTYQSSFTTRVDYVNYSQYIPSEYSHFLASGNYVVLVTPQDDPDRILLSRRFCVVENTLTAAATVQQPYDGGSIRQRREVDVCVEQNADYQGDLLLPSLNPAYLHVVVQQNGRTDTRRELPYSGYDRESLCYRNRTENLFEAGNTFRWFDISNIRTAMYNVQRIEDYGGEWFAILKPLEDRSHGNYITEKSLNGGMKVNVWDRTEKETMADYVQVNFLLPRQYPYMDGSVHVVGDLTQWKLDAGSRMEYDMDLKAYRLRLQLKQGYYAYQLLFLPVHGTQGSTAPLEGNHYEMQNDYYIYLYYRSPNDRYDRLAGYKKTS